MPRRVTPFGESALLVDACEGDDPVELAGRLRELPGVEDALAGSRTLVRHRPDEAEAVLRTVTELEPVRRSEGPARNLEVRVVFDGEDFGEVAASASMRERDLERALVDAELTVAYVGFAPGFAYMTGLPQRLAEIPRRKTPRTRVRAGSVGIAGGYAGVYPRESPGGWNLVGRSDTAMFDPEKPPYSTLQPGDRVRLVAVDSVGEAAPRQSTRPRCASSRRLVVETPGVLTTLQDGGRRKVGHLGVPRGGPADPDLMRVANLVVGNDEQSGVLEVTMEGPSVRIEDKCHLAVFGATADVDHRRVEPGAVVEARAGSRLEIGRTFGARGYLAVSGGLNGPELFGSTSSDLLSGLGPGRLVEGDEIGVGAPGTPRGFATFPPRPTTVRLVPGPYVSDAEVLRSWVSARFTVSSDSNRIGVRVRRNHDVETVAPEEHEHRGSYGMVAGAVQVPPSGDPIVLLCDHATMGGYPVVATVISCDLGVVAQARPGEELRFEVVDVGDARAARSEMDRRIRQSPSGRFPGGALA